MDNASNDEGVEKARAAAEAHWAAKHGALAEPLTVVSVQKQVVAGALQSGCVWSWGSSASQPASCWPRLHAARRCWAAAMQRCGNRSNTLCAAAGAPTLTALPLAPAACLPACRLPTASRHQLQAQPAGRRQDV